MSKSSINTQNKQQYCVQIYHTKCHTCLNVTRTRKTVGAHNRAAMRAEWVKEEDKHIHHNGKKLINSKK